MLNFDFLDFMTDFDCSSVDHRPIEMSESGFTGLMDFQDACVMCCQKSLNQDLRD